MRKLIFAVVMAGIASSSAAADAPRLSGLPGKHTTAQTIRLRADVACAPAQSYAMWTQKERMEPFFAPEAEVGRKAGDPYTVMFFPAEDPQGLVHGTKGAHILAAKPGWFLAFEWVVFAGDRTKGNHAPPYAPPAMRLPKHLPTWVELTFTPRGGGTRVEFRHYGFGSGPLWNQSRSWFTNAWGGVLERMTAVCSKG